MPRLPKSVPGRKCCWCGYPNGAGFTTFVNNLIRAGVVFKYLTPGMHFLHPQCARKAQRSIPTPPTA